MLVKYSGNLAGAKRAIATFCTEGIELAPRAAVTAINAQTVDDEIDIQELKKRNEQGKLTDADVFEAALKAESDHNAKTGINKIRTALKARDKQIGRASCRDGV